VIANVGDSRAILATKDENEVLKAIQLAINSKPNLPRKVSEATHRFTFWMWIIESAWDPDVFVGSRLVDMYAKCGSKADAWRVFNKMPSGNVVSWIVMILVHVKFCRQWQKALELLWQVRHEHVQPNSVNFLGAPNGMCHHG